jgi:hypothetical protein
MADWTEPIGHVLRSSTAGYSAGMRVNQLDGPQFGAVVKAEPRDNGRETVYGLLYDVHVDDDPLVRQLVLADSITDETINDQRHNRIVPVEINVLTVAYRSGENLVHALPPRPPLSLDPVFLCGEEEVRALTSRFEYFRLVLGTSEVPAEQLLAANLLMAAQAQPPDAQYNYLVAAGREAARLLSNDLPRLENLLRLIYP